jgi:hypothetical protein
MGLSRGASLQPYKNNMAKKEIMSLDCPIIDAI